MESKLEALTKKMKTLMQAQTQLVTQAIVPTSPILCDISGMVRHESMDCQVSIPFAKAVEEANYLGNSNKS